MKHAIWLSAFFSFTTWAAPMTVSYSDIDEKTNLADAAQVAVKGTQTLVLVDELQMTLYTFDQDQPNVSTCKAGCLTVWPPEHVPTNAIVTAPFGTITGNDGQLQLTLNGMPLYHFRNDVKPGDAFGEYGTWHVVTVIP